MTHPSHADVLAACGIDPADLAGPGLPARSAIDGAILGHVRPATVQDPVPSLTWRTSKC